MEKQSATSISKHSRRLLNFRFLSRTIVLLFCIFSHINLFAETLTPELIKNLVIVPSANKELITDTEIKFEVFIPYTDISRIDYAQPSNTSDYTFKNIRKIPSSSDIEGTHIEVWIIFNSEGTFDITPLTTKINGRNYKIPFEKISIGLNPSKQRPVLIVQVKNGITITSKDDSSSKPLLTVKAGEEVIFTTQMQYILQLVQEKSELPKDSIFKKLKTYEDIDKNFHEKETVGSIFPVAEYSWTPLVPGKVTFPIIKLSVMTYTGTKTEIKLPQVYVQVLPADEKTEIESVDYFESAFDIPAKSTETVQPVNQVISEKQCIKLAELRSKERNSLFGSAKKDRIDFEKSLGLPATEREFKLPLFYIYLFFTLLFLGILIICILKKKVASAIFHGILFVTMGVFTFYAIVQMTTKYAISKGCTIQSIPEVIVESKTELPAGTRINITAQSSGWIYVELGETCGWCHEDEVILIK